MSFDFKWYGKEVSTDIETRLQRNLDLSLQYIVSATKAELPVQTGSLKASVEYRIFDLSGQWGSDLQYASDVEFGTREQAADGTWRRVLDQNKTNIINILKGER